ncbi:metal ABC transporter substrate-binding protein [Haloimpatiens sp. FM7330]|uniref:metal ABC transporter substrate-binding protein n=1 Tax=Haloimpatiens sp. FM7330 TaxID=3298610 RepID=UPI00362FD70E
MKKTILILLAICMLSLIGCKHKNVSSNKPKVSNSKQNDFKEDKESKLNILVSNKFLYYCVKDIDGGKHNVDYLFEEKNNDIIIKYYYDIDYIPDLYIYDEFNFQKSSNKYINKIQNNKVGIINSSRGINLISYYKNITKYGEEKKTCYWNNIDNYKIILLNVKNAIVERDPINRDYYEKKFDNTLKKIREYEKVFKDKFKLLKGYTFIIQGNSLEYFMAYSGLKSFIISVDDTNSKDKINNESNKKEILKQQDNILNIVKNECEDKEKIIFIYYDDKFKKDNQSVIDEYNIKCVKINKINWQDKYEQNLKYEKSLLENVVKNCN